MLNKNKLVLVVSLAWLFFNPNVAISANKYKLPEIGTVAASSLTIDQELEFGDLYMRVLRQHQAVINDPVLNEYINKIGLHLVSNASQVRTPFKFFFINNSQLNAFAFFGGHIAIHTGLLSATTSESELASVLAHEISHVTQRHLARQIEDRAAKSPATIAALVGSTILAIAAPNVGIAALSATTALNVQSQISFTRSNESEADHFGLQTLARANYDVHAMSTFMQKLLDKYQYASSPPQILLTHPLPANRVTAARLREREYKRFIPPTSLNFHLARARIIARYSNLTKERALGWFNLHLNKTKNTKKRISYKYGKALIYLKYKDYKNAHKILDKLIATNSLNHFYIDSMCDLLNAQGKYTKTIKLLNKDLKVQPNNKVLLLNKCASLIKANKFKPALATLTKLSYRYPQDSNIWYMISQCAGKLGKRSQALSAQAELFALKANWDNAIDNLVLASKLAPLNSLEQARYDARIDELTYQKRRYFAIK